VIKIADWTERNKGRLNHIRRNRLLRGIDPMMPLALDTYVAYSAPTRQLLEFASRVGGRFADAFLRRIDEYCAKNCAQTGEIRVARSRFGAIVLSSALDPVGQSLGEQVYDALLAAGLAQRLVGDVTGDITRRPRRDVTKRSGDVTRGAVGDVTESAGDVTKPPDPDATSRDVTNTRTKIATHPRACLI
jgi:hypothetical protein